MDSIVEFCGIGSCADMKNKINTWRGLKKPFEKSFPFYFSNEFLFVIIGLLVIAAEIINKENIVIPFVI